MINEKIVLDTVKRMLDSGIEESTIISTLKDIGLSTEEATASVQKVKAPQTVSVGTTQQTGTSPMPADTSAELATLRDHVELQSNVSELHETTTHNMLNLHEQKIDAVAAKMDEVKEALSGVSAGSSDATSARLNEVVQKLDEVDAKVQSTMDLLKSILDVNRKILVELEAKK